MFPDYQEERAVPNVTRCGSVRKPAGEGRVFKCVVLCFSSSVSWFLTEGTSLTAMKRLCA